MGWRKKIVAYRRKKIISYLRKVDPAKPGIIAEKKLIPALKSGLKISEAYRNVWRQENVDIGEIRNIVDFKQKVPVTNKNNFFSPHSLSQLLGVNQAKLKLAMSSSGYSGTFAYGFSSSRALRKGKEGVDTTLDYWFDIANRKTFLINCAPMGVHVETSLPIAEVSVRSDMALALLKKVSPEFDQTIIAGDPNFLKKLVEEGTAEGIEWEKLQVSLITAQDWLPESLRSYLYSLLKISPGEDNPRAIYATMGMTELGLNVFHESKYTVALRQALKRDQQLRKQLVPTAMQAPPCIFHYYPFRTYIETRQLDSTSEMLFTVLDKDSMLPIIRYQTGDAGKTMEYKELDKILRPSYRELIPDLKLPVGIMCGRMKHQLQKGDTGLFLEDIKEGLFEDFELASSLTGLVGLEINNEEPKCIVHLKEGIKLSESLKKKIHNAANTYTSAELPTKAVPYNEMKGMVELSYERKLFLPKSSE